MKTLHDQLKTAPLFSLELFPPKTAEKADTLLKQTLPSILSAKNSAKVSFLSVTYGAGGASVSDSTIDIASYIQDNFMIPTVTHLTCNGLSKARLLQVVRHAYKRGISNFLVLGGDHRTQAAEELQYASSIMNVMKGSLNDVCLGIAGFPEGNNAFSESLTTNWQYTISKIRLGASFLITQLFFCNDTFLRFRDYICAKVGDDFPVLAGIMPITSYSQLARFSKMTAAKLPKELLDRLERSKHDDSEVLKVGTEFATRQSQQLISAGVRGIHYYCLNQDRSIKDILPAVRG